MVKSVSFMRSLGCLVGSLCDRRGTSQLAFSFSALPYPRLREESNSLASLQQHSSDLAPDERVEIQEPLKEEIEEGLELTLLLLGFEIESFGDGQLADEEADDFEDGVAHGVGLEKGSVSEGFLGRTNDAREFTSESRCFCNRAICLRTNLGEISASRTRNLENDLGPLESAVLNWRAAISLLSEGHNKGAKESVRTTTGRVATS